MGNQFLSSLEVMTSRSQCPTVLLDAETVRLCSMVIYNDLKSRIPHAVPLLNVVA